MTLTDRYSLCKNLNMKVSWKSNNIKQKIKQIISFIMLIGISMSRFIDKPSQQIFRKPHMARLHSAAWSNVIDSGHAPQTRL